MTGFTQTATLLQRTENPEPTREEAGYVPETERLRWRR
jgi:hypothetical protein